ncbi:MAG: hypothetical protein JWP87_1086 [Labilithrix sp.]|nr:hypothetical protein [Labilithrix sp.]
MRLVLAGALALSAALSSRVAVAQPLGSIGSLGAPEHVESARREGKYTFCSSPRRPLTSKQRDLCPLASDVTGCEGFAKACLTAADGSTADGDSEARTSKGQKNDGASDGSSSRQITGALGAFAQALIWLFLAVVIIAIAVPLVRALLRARRNKELADRPERATNVAVAVDRPPPPRAEEISDAEAALREADEAARRGELSRALGLYLAASLSALDRRGAIRLARHRTNGEYVRSCAEDAARKPLREIVREVDRVEFGKLTPTGDAVANVAARATAVVRATNAMTAALVISLLALTLLGCGASGDRRRGGTVDDPAGDELPMDVLRRSGIDAAYLSTSLAALPVPGPDEVAPVVVVDATRVLIEEESAAHLLRWVDAGGVLVLFGSPGSWPHELAATEGTATNDHVDVVTSEVFARGARVGNARALVWPDSDPIAFAGKSAYAAHRPHGKGMILGVAGHELFTNVGVARPDNAGVFVALLDVAMSDRRLTSVVRGVSSAAVPSVRVARAEDGIPPPSNPFSALVQAGLGKGSWHALAAAIVLFLAYGIRQARPRPAPAPARRAFAEHVEATGAFYGRAHAHGHALASYGRYAEMRLRERVPRGADPVQFLATRAKVPRDDAARVWKRATEASADEAPRGDELTTIRDLGAMLAKALETG